MFPILLRLVVWLAACVNYLVVLAQFPGIAPYEGCLGIILDCKVLFTSHLLDTWDVDVMCVVNSAANEQVCKQRGSDEKATTALGSSLLQSQLTGVKGRQLPKLSATKPWVLKKACY